MKQLISSLLIAAVTATAASAHAAPASYAIDPGHSSLLFSVDHAGWARVYGFFRQVKGQLSFDPDNLSATKVDVTIDAASLTTNNAKRDEHLRSPDFFNVAEFPEVRFASSAVQVTGKRTAKLTGTLTLLGVERPVQLDVVFNDLKPDTYTRQVKAGFSLSGKLKRSDFGMTYAVPRVSDEVQLTIEVESVAQSK